MKKSEQSGVLSCLRRLVSLVLCCDDSLVSETFFFELTLIILRNKVFGDFDFIRPKTLISRYVVRQMDSFLKEPIRLTSCYICSQNVIIDPIRVSLFVFIFSSSYECFSTFSLLLY